MRGKKGAVYLTGFAPHEGPESVYESNYCLSRNQLFARQLRQFWAQYKLD